MGEIITGVEHEEPSMEELNEDGLTKEEAERASFEVAKEQYSIRKDIPSGEQQEYSKEIAELEQMFRDFQEKYSFKELMAITEFTTIEEIRQNPIREPARQALIPITEKLLSIPRSKQEELGLNKQYHKLWLAVGIVRNYKIIHKD